MAITRPTYNFLNALFFCFFRNRMSFFQREASVARGIFVLSERSELFSLLSQFFCFGYLMPIFCVCVCVCVCPYVRRARGRNFIQIFTKIAQNLYFMNISKVLFLFFEIIFFSISKKLKTSKMALKLGLFSNNSRIVMKNDFYYQFSILNMFLSSKMTFYHFWGYPFLPKLAKIDIFQ